jgi:type III pantothenate kinase
MLITIDIGNSQISCVVFRHGQRAAGWRLPTDTQRTLDEYALVLESLMLREGLAPNHESGAVLSSVVPALSPVFVELATQWTGRPPVVLGPGTASGMPIRYSPPTALGPDRLADAVGAVERFGAPVVVVDMGTATTFNVVDPQGAFVGGAIAPGVSVMADALVRSGARLSTVDMTAGPGEGDIGRSTEQAVRLGVMHGHAGLVTGMLRRIIDELGAPPRSQLPVVATGGWSRVVAPLVPRIDAVVPDLLVEGLRAIHERNAALATPPGAVAATEPSIDQGSPS